MALFTCVMARGQNNVRLEYEGYQQDFTTLQAAFNALPPNSTPATVTLLNDVSMNFESGYYVRVPQYSNVTIELAGYAITASLEKPSTSCLIENKGTLTIEDHSAGKTGIITASATKPDPGTSNPYGWATYGGYTITNMGTLIVNSGTIENNTPNANCNYPIDNRPAALTTSRLIINGGKILQNSWDDAIRLYPCAGGKAIMEVNDGEIISRNSCVFIHGDGAIGPTYNNKNVLTGNGSVELTINGGIWKSIGTYEQTPNKLEPGDYRIVDCLCFGNGKKMDEISVVVNDGDFYGMVYTRSTGVTPASYEHIEINGGRWHSLIDYEGEQPVVNPVFITRYDTDGQDNHYGQMIKGGVIDALSNVEKPTTWYDDWYSHNTTHKIWGSYIAQGYCADDNGDNTWTIAPCETKTTTASQTMAEIVAPIVADPDKEVEATIIEIDARATSADAVVTVTQDIAVEGIVIKATNDQDDATKEGQIVVNSGVTLTIGNSGIVSENNDLTTVVVKPGGTVIVGNGGVTKTGTATPVEIQSTGTESGVFLIDPNASTALAEAPAKVKVYTRAHKDGGIEYWQQFASPVKGNMTITPLGVGQEAGVFTSIYGWDYSADEWVRVPGMPKGSDDVKYFDKDGWSGENILAPFAAYNLINNSLLSEGGITYEFAGELVGNDDMVLTFPANGFCVFGNSYTAPIDLTTLFDQIQNDMSLDNIDAVVYIYNSAKDRFDAVNALTLELDSWGFAEAPFTQIPPQQAFVMNLLAGGSAQTAVDYAKSVWGNPQTNKNTPIMAPKRANNNTISAALNIQVTDGEATDRVFVVEDSKYSNAYDNGADAEKYMNANFNIYANSTERNLAMVATDDIENTTLTFAAGNAVNYTMSFENVLGDYMLIDNLNNNQIAIVEGATYEFVAQPNSTVEGRFSIAPIYKTPTAIENAEVKSNVKGIYTLTGQFVGEDFKALPAGVYVIDGVKIVK